MIQTKLYSPLFSLGSVFLGIQTFILMYHFYYGIVLFDRWIIFSAFGFWCILLSLLWYDIEKFVYKYKEYKKKGIKVRYLFYNARNK